METLERNWKKRHLRVSASVPSFVKPYKKKKKTN